MCLKPGFPKLPVLLVLMLLATLAMWKFIVYAPPEPIRIGVLHSLSGEMAASERPLLVAVRLAVNEINAQGGVFGHPLEIVVADGQSDPAIFAKRAEQLITQDKVSAIFGCWTLQARKAVKAIVEAHHHLLFYPLPYEGLEQSPAIIYTGSTPNQQIIPATHWALKNLGKRAYLLGSDAIYPRIAHQIIRDFVRVAQGDALAEHYAPLGGADFAAVISDIERLKPDVIFNTLIGDSNEHFFKALALSSAKNTAVLSFTITENELKQFPSLTTANHYAARAYFQSIETSINQDFVRDYQQLASSNKTPLLTFDPVEASYAGVHLWAQAAQDIQSTEAEHINAAVLRQSFHAPSGIVSIDKATRHTWKMLYIAKAQANGQFKIIESSAYPIRPEPFPGYRTLAEWLDILDTLRRQSP